MPRIRKIRKIPATDEKNYFVVDACFLANKYIPQRVAPKGQQKDRIRACVEWWKEIDRQISNEKARVYVPDVCIAEAFKVLAKKWYVEKWFKWGAELKTARDRLSKDISIPPKQLKKQTRRIGYHDIPTSRDIIIAVDRFFELFMKHGFEVSLPDLIIVATAKYLMDFYDLPRKQLHIITLDKQLWAGTKKILELPNAYDPTEPKDSFTRIFE